MRAVVEDARRPLDQRGPRTRVKVCGNRSGRDVALAVAAGVDAVGLICGLTHRSEDGLDAPRAAALARQVPPYVTTVLVTHLAAPDRILDLVDAVGPDLLQLHGEIEPDCTREVRRARPAIRIVQAVHVTGEAALTRAQRFEPHCDALLLDSRTADRLGGTGITHDWSLSRRIVDRARVPVILSGGLTDRNVIEAIRTVRPFAVDVNSGVDDPAGDKDPARLDRFVHAAQHRRVLHRAD
jgi:phosphoribosylanthranilate isomerase